MRLKLQELVSKDEKMVALQKTLQMKQQEREKRKETEKAKSKSNERMAAQNVKSYSHKKVSAYYTQYNHVLHIYNWYLLHFILPS